MAVPLTRVFSAAGRQGVALEYVLLAVALIAMALLFVFLAIFWSIFRLWIQAAMAGAPIPVAKLLTMKLRRIKVKKVVHAYVMARQAGLHEEATFDKLAEHARAGGDPELVVRGMIAAREDGGADLDFDQAAAADLDQRQRFQRSTG